MKREKVRFDNKPSKPAPLEGVINFMIFSHVGKCAQALIRTEAIRAMQFALRSRKAAGLFYNIQHKTSCQRFCQVE
jgi:hypothetical protein